MPPALIYCYINKLNSHMFSLPSQIEMYMLLMKFSSLLYCHATIIVLSFFLKSFLTLSVFFLLKGHNRSSMCCLGLRRPVSHTSATPKHTISVTRLSLTYFRSHIIVIQPSWEHIDINVCICRLINNQKSPWWSLWHYANWISELK